jgi:dipeptidyl aminopeptidase/acylaminoacyl peptidase
MHHFKKAIGLLFIATLAIFFAVLIKTKNSNCPLIPREILFGNDNKKTSPKISPDGLFIVYNAPVNNVMNLWLKSIGKNDDKPITFDAKQGIRWYLWSWDSSSIFYIQDVNGNQNWRVYSVSIDDGAIKEYTPFDNVKALPIKYIKEFPYRMLIKMNKRNVKVHDIYELNTQTGDLNLIEENPGNVQDWIADSNLDIRAKVESLEDGGFNLFVRNSKTSEWRLLGNWTIEDAMPSVGTRPSDILNFSTDGKFLFIKDARNHNAKSYVKINISTGEIIPLAQDDAYDIEGIPLYDLDTYEPLAISYLKDRKHWIFFDKKIQDTFEIIRSLDSGDITIESRSLDDNLWIVGFDKDNDSSSHWLIDRTSGNSTFLFDSDNCLKKYKLSPMQPISFTARDGLTIHGYLTYPCGKNTTQYKKNLPLVVLIHGGPWSRDAWGFSAEVQWLANRGYAVLQINFRGSTGYGKAFLNAGDKQWGRAMQNDITDAVHWAINEEIADPKKIAIYGTSYGGYAALAGATLTPELYNCAIDVVGPSNLVTCLKSIPPYWSTQIYTWYNRVGNPYTEQEFLNSISPLFFVDAIRIPILVAHGANDPIVKQAESEQIVAAMKAKNISYEYLLFPDEGHGFVKPENKLKFYKAAENFLAEHLGGRYES